MEQLISIQVNMPWKHLDPPTESVSVDLEWIPRSAFFKSPQVTLMLRVWRSLFGHHNPKEKKSALLTRHPRLFIEPPCGLIFPLSITHSSLTCICTLPSELSLAVMLSYSNKISVHTAFSIYNALPIILLPSQQTSTHSSRLWSNAVSPVKTSPIFPGRKTRHFLFWSQNKIGIYKTMSSDRY